MPIVDIEQVADAGLEPGLARRLADRLGDVFGTGPGRTWVRLRRLEAEHYAENDVPDLMVRPVFVDVTLAELPDDLSELATRVCAAVADTTGCPEANVHVCFSPPARGRIAFGGRL